MEDLAFDERDAAAAWARAYNTHDPSHLEPHLAEDVRVMSRWVVRDLIGRDTYLRYLTGKFRTFERVGSMVRVDVGTAHGEPSSSGRPCAILEQDGSLLATVLFDVIGGRIWQISLGDQPPPASCRRAHVFPGFGTGDQSVN